MDPETHQSRERQDGSRESPTYKNFQEGDDPRSCVVIGEDTKPVYFCFETSDRNLMLNVRTIVYKNNKEVCAKLEWTPGNNLGLGSATLGTREMPMSHLVLTGSCQGARSFLSSDGLQFEWRRDQDTPSSYDLYAGSDKPIAVFRRFSQPQPTAIGPAHGLFQYSFNRDHLLIESLVALCINRWIDLHVVPVYSVGL